MSEEYVVRQCAPTLAGIKTGSLFPCPYQSRQALMSEIRALNRRLSPKGLILLPVRYLDGKALLYLYRPSNLRQDLKDRLATQVLEQAGYSCSAIPRRTSRALSTTVPATSSAPACGRYTETRRGHRLCLPGSGNAPKSTASYGKRAPVSSSSPLQFDQYKPERKH